MPLAHIRLKKGEDRRVRRGHPWIYSNEIDTALTPLKKFTPGEEVIVLTHDQQTLGVAYINPHSLIAGRLFTRDASERLNTPLIKTRLQEAQAFREQLFHAPYYRLVFSEADRLPGLVIDRFDKDFVVQINTAGMEQKTAEIIEALVAVFPDTNSILLRNDSPIREQEGLKIEVKPGFGDSPQEVTLSENGVQFIAPLQTGQKTGWFYDHRLNRARLKEYVKNARVLDVFSYLGGFGIQAAAFGAKTVDCIDASKFACDYIAKNAALNQVSAKVNVIADDAFDALKKLLEQNNQYDVIILDPPAFVKKAKDRQQGLIAYQRLNEFALKLLRPGGLLVSCSCSMHVSMDDMLELLQRAAFRTETTIQLLERGHQGPDHPIHLAIPETDYLKAMFVRKLEK